MNTKTINPKDVNFSLQNADNYKVYLDANMQQIMSKYSALIIEFLNLICDNFRVKNKDYNHFIIVRGINTITNVFNDILFYTKNLELTSFHVQKAYYLYTEFVEQITEDQHAFLQLSSRDASMYVYKKTILEINNDMKKKTELYMEDIKNANFEIIIEYSKIVRIIIGKLIYTDFKEIKTYLDKLLHLLNKLSNIDFDINYLIEINNILNILDVNVNNNFIYIEKLENMTTFLNSNNPNKIKKFKEKLMEEFTVNT